MNLWPDSAGTETLPTTSFFASSVTTDVGHDNELHLLATISGAAMPALALDVRVSVDGSTWRRIKRITIQGAAVGSYPVVVKVPPFSQVIIDARGWRPNALTRLVVTGQLRRPGADADINGQPLEIAYHQEDGVEVFGDGAAGAAVMTAGPNITPEPSAAAAQQWLPVGEADTLVVDFEVSVLAATTVELEVRERHVGSAVEVEQVAVNSVNSGVIGQTVAQDQISGTADVHRTREIPVRPGTEILILAQRTGGGATTEGYGVARLYKLGSRA